AVPLTGYWCASLLVCQREARPPIRSQMSFEPRADVPDKLIGIRLELQGMVSAGILDDLLVTRGEALSVVAGAGVVDDAIALRQQHQHRQRDVFRHEAEIAVEPGAFEKEAGRSLSDRLGIVAKKPLPARRRREELRIVERNIVKLARPPQPRPQDAEPTTKRQADLRKKAGA